MKNENILKKKWIVREIIIFFLIACSLTVFPFIFGYANFLGMWVFMAGGFIIYIPLLIISIFRIILGLVRLHKISGTLKPTMNASIFMFVLIASLSVVMWAFPCEKARIVRIISGSRIEMYSFKDRGLSEREVCALELSVPKKDSLQSLSFYVGQQRASEIFRIIDEIVKEERVKMQTEESFSSKKKQLVDIPADNDMTMQNEVVKSGLDEHVENDWKEYLNSKLGYQISIPNNFDIESDNEGGVYFKDGSKDIKITILKKEYDHIIKNQTDVKLELKKTGVYSDVQFGEFITLEYSGNVDLENFSYFAFNGFEGYYILQVHDKNFFVNQQIIAEIIKTFTIL